MKNIANIFFALFILLIGKSYFSYYSLMNNGKLTVGTINGKSYISSNSFVKYKFKTIESQLFFFGKTQVSSNRKVKYDSLKYIVLYDTLNPSNNYMILQSIEEKYQYGEDLSLIFDKESLGLTFWNVVR